MEKSSQVSPYNRKHKSQVVGSVVPIFALAFKIVRVSATFPFSRGDTLDDGEEGVTIHMCCHGNCKRGSGRVQCFHEACYAFRLFPITSTFLAATEYDYRPSNDRERPRRMQNALAENLKLDYLKALSREICWVVAGFLTRECAVVGLQEATSTADAPHSSPPQTQQKIRLSEDIYARFFPYRRRPICPDFVERALPAS